MKIRKSTTTHVDKVEQQMTPMIDIVFLLLIFFMFSFKIASPEGDFNIKMPVASQAMQDVQETTLPIKVRLRADAAGNLAAIAMNDRDLGTDFGQLRLQIISIVGGDAGPGSAADATECELECDYHLRYESVIEAITAISGYLEGNQIVKLIQKIRFSPPEKQ